MSRIWSGIWLFALLCAPLASQDKKDHGKTPELTKKFTDFMKENAKDFKGIKEDIEADKPEADIKKKLAGIRLTMVKAKELKYRKDEDEEEKLQGLFDVFELKIKQDFEGVAWENKERRLFLLERLQAKCDVCHELYRD
jgi:hypothetical protein